MFLRFAIPSAGDVRSESYANLRETAGKQPPHKHENQQQTSSLHAVFLIPKICSATFLAEVCDPITFDRRASPLSAWLKASI